MEGKLIIDSYRCNNCGFKFLGSTRMDPRINRLVLCPKCGGPTKIKKFVFHKSMLFLILCGVAAALVMGVGKYFGWF